MFATVTNQVGFLPDEGKYTIECLRIEEAPDNGFGVGVRWVLALYDGNTRVDRSDGSDFEFWQTTSPSMGPKARARHYVEALLGRQLDEGERVNPNDLIGKRMSGMVIHEDSKSKPGTPVAKLVSVKPLASNGAATAKPTPRPSVAQVPPDATDADVDRALLISSVEKKVAQAVKLGTSRHLDWIALDLSKLDVKELETIKAAIQMDIDA